MDMTPLSILLALPAPLLAPQGDYDEFGTTLEELAFKSELPGLSAAIVRDGKVAWSLGIGYADLENEILATPDTRYRLASCSKPLAAAVATKSSRVRSSMDKATPKSPPPAPQGL